MFHTHFSLLVVLSIFMFCNKIYEKLLWGTDDVNYETFVNMFDSKKMRHIFLTQYSKKILMKITKILYYTHMVIVTDVVNMTLIWL